MTTRKEQRQIETVNNSAARFIELKRQVDELTKEMNLHKKVCTDYARSIEAESVDINGVKVERRTTVKGCIDKSLVSPHWLWEMTDNGYGDMLGIDIDARQVSPTGQDETLDRLLGQVGYTEKEGVTYAVRT